MKSKEKSSNYMEQVSITLDSCFHGAKTALEVLEKEVTKLIQEKSRESFKNGIEVGKKQHK